MRTFRKSVKCVLTVMALMAGSTSIAHAQFRYRGPYIDNTPLDPRTWVPRGGGGGDSGSSLMVVPDPATVRNTTNRPLAFSIDGNQQTRLQPGYRNSYSTGSNTGNYRPVTIRFENGRGAYKQYALGSGSYRFQFTNNGLDLTRDR